MVSMPADATGRCLVQRELFPNGGERMQDVGTAVGFRVPTKWRNRSVRLHGRPIIATAVEV
jgi:hypothetical protein